MNNPIDQAGTDNSISSDVDKPVDLRLYGCHLENWYDYNSTGGVPIWRKFGRQMKIQIEKQQILM